VTSWPTLAGLDLRVSEYATFHICRWLLVSSPEAATAAKVDPRAGPVQQQRGAEEIGTLCRGMALVTHHVISDQC